jgi:hypothetical protein
MARGFFRPAPFFSAFPLYRNSAVGNGAETRDTIYKEDNESKDSIIYYDYIWYFKISTVTVIALPIWH